MAFLRKAGSIFRQSLAKNINAQNIAVSNPSILQAIRCMSSSKVFVGGLSYSTDETSLREAFTKYGEVVEARVINDRETGRSRGFGFVTFTAAEEASAAIQALDGQELHGRTVRVNYANDRPRTFGGGGYGGGGYGGGGGGYGGGGGGGYGGGNDGGGYGGSYGGGVSNYGNSYGGVNNNQTQGGGYYGGGNQGFSGGGSGLGGLGDVERQQSVGGYDGLDNGVASSGGFGHDDALDKDEDDGDEKQPDDDYANRRA